MKLERTNIPDLILIKPDVYRDDRGYFFESFRHDLLEEELGYEVNFIQDNESKSTKGVLRGLHYQVSPFEQSKLVRVIEGNVLDVVVDIRKNSPTFAKHFSIELSGDNKYQLLLNALSDVEGHADHGKYKKDTIVKDGHTPNWRHI